MFDQQQLVCFYVEVVVGNGSLLFGCEVDWGLDVVEYDKVVICVVYFGEVQFYGGLYRCGDECL